jgi:endonuclease G
MDDRAKRLAAYLRLIAKDIATSNDSVLELVQPDLGLAVTGFEGTTRDAAQGRTDLVFKLLNGGPVLPGELATIEAIIDEDLRPAFDVVNGDFRADHPRWMHLQEPARKQMIQRCLPSIGRVELPGHPTMPYGGTGFVVGDDLLMTNRHVAEVFASGVGTRSLAFRDQRGGAVDFVREHMRPPGAIFHVRGIVMIHPYWDMALLRVPGISAGRQPLRLAIEDARDLSGREIFVVGYPAFDPRNPADVQNGVFQGRYGIKKLQPGELKGAVKSGSYGKWVQAAGHDCSTLGGNSGSAVIDLASGAVLSLHFGGRYHELNYSVPAGALARDARVVDAGVAFVADPVTGPTEWDDWWRSADEGESATGGAPAPHVAAADGTGGVVAAPPAPQALGRGGMVTFTAAGGLVRVRVPGPLQITVEETDRAGDRGETPYGLDSAEKLVEPFRDDDYRSRRGYKEWFLDEERRRPAFRVPMPAAALPEVLAPTRNGGTILHYQNFSVAIHAKRRLALFTASNITKEDWLRKPDKTKKYGRKDLSGLGEHDQEMWFLDRRMDAGYQLPDEFFTNDRQAFDKGHIVRREDVAWGDDYDTLRRANGDTYHVTNCSPQVAGFNRSNLGSENWGALENVVLSAAASERLCVFAGPVLRARDQVFVGRGRDGAPLRARIPESYWKVVVAVGDASLEAFGFILEQDLGDVAWTELLVPDKFVPALYPLATIEQRTGVVFADELKEVDQYERAGGAELVMRGFVRGTALEV